MNWSYIGDRFKEIGTWRLLAAVAAGAFSVTISDATVQTGFEVFSGVLVLIEAFHPSKPKDVPAPAPTV